MDSSGTSTGSCRIATIPRRSAPDGVRLASVPPIVSDHARVRSRGPGQHRDQGGLARAVLTNEGEDSAGVQRDVDVVEGDSAAEALADASARQHRLAGHTTPTRRGCSADVPADSVALALRSMPNEHMSPRACRSVYSRRHTVERSASCAVSTRAPRRWDPQQARAASRSALIAMIVSWPAGGDQRPTAPQGPDRDSPPGRRLASPGARAAADGSSRSCTVPRAEVEAARSAVPPPRSEVPDPGRRRRSAGVDSSRSSRVTGSRPRARIASVKPAGRLRSVVTRGPAMNVPLPRAE